MAYLILDVDVSAVVDEKPRDVHVVVYEAVEDGKMKSCPAVLTTNTITSCSPLQHQVNSFSSCSAAASSITAIARQHYERRPTTIC